MNTLNYIGWAASEINSGGFVDFDHSKKAGDEYRWVNHLASSIEDLVSGMKTGQIHLHVFNDKNDLRRNLWNYMVEDLLKHKPPTINFLNEDRYLNETFALQTVYLVRDLRSIKTISSEQRESVADFLRGLDSYVYDRQRYVFQADGTDLDLL